MTQKNVPGICLLLFCRAVGILFFESGTYQTDFDLFYSPLAKAILERGEYALVPGIAFVQKVPGYPLFLALWFSLGITEGVMLQGVHLAVESVLIFYLYRTLRLLFGDNPATFFGVTAFLLQPFTAFYAATFSRDMLFACCLMVSVFYWLKASRRPTPQAISLWAGFQSMTLYVREDGIYYFAFFFIGLLICIFSKRPPKTTIRTCCIPLGILCLVLSPWMIRNMIQVGAPLPTGALRFSRVFIVSNVQFDVENKNNPAPWPLIDSSDKNAIEDADKRLSDPALTFAQMQEANDDFDAIAKKYVKKNGLGYFIFQIPKNVLRTIASPRMDRFSTQPAIKNFRQDLESAPLWALGSIFLRGLHSGLFIFGAFGLFLLARRSPFHGAILLAALFPLFSSSILGQMNPRYELPSIGFLVLGIAEWVNRIGFYGAKQNSNTDK